jgi:hypothetical protein
MEEVYFEAIERENWHRTLLLYQEPVAKPFLAGIDSLIHAEPECQESEARPIIITKEWVAEVNDLLGL